MKSRDFKQNLSLYGADLEQWPVEIRENAKAAYQSSPELQELVVEEERFEQLLTTCKTEEPSADLAQRIIAAARKPLAKQDSNNFTMADLLAWFLSPRMAMGLVCILIIGFLLGYSSPLANGVSAKTELVAFLYDSGELP